MKIAILDDSTDRSRAISECIRGLQSDLIVSLFSTPFSLVTEICDVYKGDIDLIIVHVSSEFDERISMACDLQANYPHLRIIFYSEDCGCAENIFEAEPSGFLKIPIKKEKLKKLVERVMAAIMNDRRQIVSIRSKGQTQRLKLSSIKYIENAGRKIVFYTDLGDFEAYMKFEDILPILSDSFFQSHRSYIVNMDKLKSINSGDIILYSGERIPVARSHQKMLKEALKIT